MIKVTLYSCALILLSFGTSIQGEPAMPACFCPFIYMPVCASNGVTFPNQCQFRCAQKDEPRLTLLGEGPCVEKNAKMLAVPEIEEEAISDCFCTLIYRPVCGSDGKTYASSCLLECARKTNPALSIARYEECTADNVEIKPRQAVQLPAEIVPTAPRCICPKIYKPVCGSNKITYSNRCELGCAQKLNKEIMLMSQGPC